MLHILYIVCKIYDNDSIFNIHCLFTQYKVYIYTHTHTHVLICSYVNACKASIGL